MLSVTSRLRPVWAGSGRAVVNQGEHAKDDGVTIGEPAVGPPALFEVDGLTTW
jgi:hypothetical protein